MNARFPKHQMAGLPKGLSAFEQAQALQKAGNNDQAIKIYEKILEKNPKHYHAQLHLGVCHFGSGRFDFSSHIFHQLHVKFPDEDEVLKFAGISYMSLGNFEMALKFHRKYVKAHPDDYETWLNLTSVSGSMQNNTEALYYATHAMSLEPLDVRSHINLGATLILLHRYEDALISFDTALLFEPNNLKALINKATCYGLMSDQVKAIEIFERCEELVGSDDLARAEIQYNMSFPLLKMGNLKRGLKYYDMGFIPLDTRSRTPKRSFSVPEWDGSPIHGKRLMVWREQGLGDEIKFASMIPDLLPFCDDVIIECDKRMVSIFQRSFPTCTVREQFHNGGILDVGEKDFDFHIPMGSLMTHLRADIAAFAHPRPYLVPDPQRVEEIKRRLDMIRNGRTLIGICWRSGFLTTERNIHYTAISDWEPIFANKNFAFVNLQYGESRQEILNAEQHFGIKIHHWDDIDLKDDQESVMALISNMDCVVSAGTAVITLAEAIGKKAKVFILNRDWTHLGQEAFPWALDNVEYFMPTNEREGVATTIPYIAESLAADFGSSA